MKKLLYPIQVNESSFRVPYLHLALAALGMMVNEQEKAAKLAGGSTLKLVRELQRSLNVPFDDKVLLDTATASAIEKELKARGLVDDDCTFTVNGTVMAASGHIVSQVKLMAFDIDLKGAALYRKAGKLEEIEKNGGFELLGETESGRNGTYSFTFYCDQFKNAERKKADIVVFAIDNEDTITGRSGMVNTVDYSSTGEVRNLNVLLANQDKVIEYSQVMDVLLPFLEESGVTLRELADSKEQIAFAAGESDTDALKITIAAKAEALIAGTRDKISHELLYGLGRENIQLDWFSLNHKKESELLAALKAAIEKYIINPHQQDEIQDFLNTISQNAGAEALQKKGGNSNVSLDEVLSNALPEQEQRLAFVNATRSFKGLPEDFWQSHLPSQPEFQDKPELISSLLLTQQLTLITGNHQPLVAALQKGNNVKIPTDLLEFSTDEWYSLLKNTGLPDSNSGYSKDEQIKGYAQHIQNTLHAAYPTQKIALMLQKNELPVEAPVAEGINSFLSINTGFSFAGSNIHEFEKEIREVENSKQVEVKNELLRMQRIFQVSPGPDTMGVLMKHELNSAYAIAAIPQNSFLKTYAKELGGAEVAMAVHQKASYINARAEMNAMTMMEVLNGVNPGFVMSATDHSALMNTLSNKLPDYSELFGSPDICECEHCRSVYSPAAYFVDLLRFLWRGVKNSNNQSPLDLLTNRRPDLLHLPLTCENSNTLIPYIDLVNEIMEFYTVNSSLNTYKGFDTSDTSGEDLRADPQNVNLEAYRRLKDAVFPFTLPYHQPLDVIRTYGNHLKTARHDVMKALETGAAQEATLRAIAAESLSISQEEYIILAKQNFAGVADTTLLHQYFGYANAANLEQMAGVREFLRQSGIAYTDLVALISTRFINPHQDVFDFIQDLFISSSLNAAAIYARLQQVNAGTLIPANDAALMATLNAAGISSDDFILWVKQNFGGFNAVITLYEPHSQCGLDTTFLRTLGNVYAGTAASGITNETWSKIHRFIRLWRKLGWAVHEVDLVLTSFGDTDILPATIHKLSSLVVLNSFLKRPLNQVAAFWGSIDMYGSKSLYKKLFLNKTILNLDPAFGPDKWGNYFSDQTALLSNHIPAILAAFRMSQEDLDAVLSVATVTDGGVSRRINIATDKLTLANLSIFYRYATFSKALKLNISDFTLLLRLFNASPFSKWNVQSKKFEQIVPSEAFQFYKLATSIKTNGIKPVELQYILTGLLPTDSTLGLNMEKAGQTAKAIRNSFTAIEQQYPPLPAVPVTEDLLRSTLSLSFSQDVVSRLLNIINGSDGISLITGNNLNIIIPDLLKAKFSYINASGRLTVNGTVTDAEQISLKGLHADAGYKAAVDALYKAPEAFVRENFSGVFNNMATAFATLLNHPAQAVTATTEEKWQFVYSNYLPVLKQKLRENALTQHFAALISLPEDITKVLISTDMHNMISSTVTQGHAASYFTDATRTTLALERIDKEINFDWQAGSPDGLPGANNFSARWQAYLTPPASDKYTLAVQVNEADETFNLYVDDLLILQKAAADTLVFKEVSVSLNASKMHRLTLEYAEGTGTAGIRLYWKTATTALVAIPATASFPAKMVDDFIGLATLYHRAAKFITRFNLNERELSHFVSYKADFDNIDCKAITALHIKRMSDYVLLRQAVPQAQATLTDVFKAANVTNPIPAVNELKDLLVLATAWDPISLGYLVNTHFALNNAHFKNEKALLRLYNALSIITRTGISAPTVAIWGRADTGFDILHGTAQLIKSTVKARYEETDWLDIAPRLSDKIRENQKQALISYLLVQPSLKSRGVEDADGLFEYFLIDVQMGACMDTSRIVQATAAMQQFVNRCLLNLESNKTGNTETGVSPEAIDTDRWQWMKNYRVWEANRKVFLYPENWLEPEWRDDRSAFFKDLESELVQNDITERSVETAFRTYLTRLNEVANLEVCGVCEENDDEGKLKLFHVFGRTHNAPYQVFYRTWDKYMKWNAWSKVQTDVRNVENGDYSGVHLLPVVWKKRLFLFWTELIEKKEVPAGAKSKTPKDVSEDNTLGSLEPRIYWEVRLAWTEYADQKWTPKQLSKEFIVQMSGTVIPEPSRIRLVADIDANNKLSITTHCEFDGGWIELGAFVLADITSKIEVKKLTGGGNAFENQWAGYSLAFMNYKKTAALTLLDDNYLRRSTTHKLLLPAVRKNYIPRLDSPFFFSDAVRTYFVRPVDIKILDKIRNPKIYKPFIPNLVDERYHHNPYRVPEIGPDDLMPPGDLFNEPLINIAGGVAVRNRTMNMPATPVMRMMTSNHAGVSDTTSAVAATPMRMQRMMNEVTSVGAAFAGINLSETKTDPWRWNYRWDKGLEFHTFYHPFSNDFVTRLNQKGMDGLMQSDTAISGDSGQTFTNQYNPNFNNGFVQKPADFTSRTYFKENVCFDVYGANSLYNWELFFHAPLYIATRLSKNGRYKEAMDWFHYIFDPTTNALPGPGQSETSRYWKVLPFKTTPAENLEEWFANLAPNSNPATENLTIGEWSDNPFMPHLVARNRPVAYMKNVVIKYAENLLEWGDSLFRRFTRESVNEALQLYVIANHILGPRPQFIPKRGTVKAETYNSLSGKLDDFSNAVVQLENLFPYSSSIPVAGSTAGSNLLGIGEALYFCIPANEKLMEYWDRAADRLYKIRHCMDIDGVERKLALFAPPIDPAALIRAASQGLSLGSILADLSSPPPVYRFTFLIQKANEFCNEVKILGNTLLSVLEKKDSEALGRLRTTHERSLLELVTSVRERQVLEAKANRENLSKVRETLSFRLKHFNDLLGNEGISVGTAPTIPATLSADSSLPADTALPILATDVDESLVDSGEAGVKLIPREKQELDLGLAGMMIQQVATGIEGIAGMMNFIPSFSAEFEPLGCGGSISFGGSNIAGGMSGYAKIPQGIANVLTYMAAQSAKMAGYIRREQEWTFNANLAAKEIIQLDKQITAADIRIQIAEKELANHLQQIENAKAIEQFLRDKFTNQELYQWMKEQLVAVYKQSYNMGYDMAKKAEKAYRYESGNDTVTFIQYGYWDDSYQGLLAGEKLQLALRQLEKSHIEQSKRELELRKNVSLAFVNPLALQELRQTGRCYITLPEEIFDIDFQGHYARRIKSVSLSIPCIAGPQTTISCSLRLLKNVVRINTSMNEDGNYEHLNDEGLWIDDDRFRSSHVPVQAIAISHAQNDAGLFELNFRDERYLPFEGAGAISDWKIELTTDEDLRQFDYSTISDIIMHVSYTAKEDAGQFRDKATAYIKSFLTNAAELSTQPLMRMFSIRHEFSADWYKFLHPAIAGSDQVMNLTLKKEHFPFFTRNRHIDVMQVDVLIKSVRTGDYHLIMKADDEDDNTMTSSQITMPENDTFGGMQKVSITGSDTGITVEDINIEAPMSLTLKHSSDANYHSLDTDPEELEDVFIVIHYKLSDV